MQRDAGALSPTDIFAGLNKARVKYLVVGGIAVVLYGVNRATWDVDVAVHLTVPNLKRLDKALQRLGFSRRVPASVLGLADPRIRRQWTVDKGMRVYSYLENTPPQRTIDVMVQPLRDFDALYRRRTTKRADGVAIPLVPVRTLAAMKRRAGRPQDLQDLRDLRQLKKI